MDDKEMIAALLQSNKRLVDAHVDLAKIAQRLLKMLRIVNRVHEHHPDARADCEREWLKDAEILAYLIDRRDK